MKTGGPAQSRLTWRGSIAPLAQAPELPMNQQELAHLRRRVCLRQGTLSAFGLTLGSLLRAQRPTAAGQPERAPTAKACILLYMTGGPAQQETFDMKPLAPQAARGEFRPIATCVPGTQVCELLPRVAQCAHLFACIRSTHHDQTFHGAGSHLNLTGFAHAPREPTPEFYLDRRDSPSIGGVLQQLAGERGGLPAAVQLPWWVGHGFVERFAGQTAGFLGSRYDPFQLFYDKKEALPGALPAEYSLGNGVLPRRHASRLEMLSALDRAGRAPARRERQYERYQAQAIDILNSNRAWRAFSIADEPPRTVERYGATKFGRSCLVARRLVEAGVRLVTVTWPGHESHFDTHADHFRTMREELLPPMDMGFSALLEDLHNRGLLDQTLVAWTGEFGRTPALNGNKPPGRDHWPWVYSTVLAGGGVRGGQVYGASDDVAGHPKDRPVHVRDFVATIYHALGYDDTAKVVDVAGREHDVMPGRPVEALF